MITGDTRSAYRRSNWTIIDENNKPRSPRYQTAPFIALRPLDPLLVNALSNDDGLVNLANFATNARRTVISATALKKACQ